MRSLINLNFASEGPRAVATSAPTVRCTPYDRGEMQRVDSVSMNIEVSFWPFRGIVMSASRDPWCKPCAMEMCPIYCGALTKRWQGHKVHRAYREKHDFSCDIEWHNNDNPQSVQLVVLFLLFLPMPYAGRATPTRTSTPPWGPS